MTTVRTLRGELWTVSGGPGYAGKPRPALIVQAELYEDAHSVTICGLTTGRGNARFTRPHVEPGTDNGLDHPSQVMVDKIMTVPRSRLGNRLGNLSPPDMRRVHRALLVFLGLVG